MTLSDFRHQIKDQRNKKITTIQSKIRYFELQKLIEKIIPTIKTKRTIKPNIFNSNYKPSLYIYSNKSQK